MPPLVPRFSRIQSVASLLLVGLCLTNATLFAEDQPARLPEVALGEAVSIREYCIDSTLKEWALHSTLLTAISDIKRREIERQLKPVHTGHQISLIVALSGPVKIEQLRNNFAWSLETSTEKKTVLIATPKEKLENIFNGKIRVELDHDTLPSSVSFTGSKPVTSSNVIQLTGFRQPVPVAFPGQTPIRSAAYTVEAPLPVEATEEPRKLPVPELGQPVD